MSNVYGKNIKITVFGQSHSPQMGVVIDGFPAGIKIDTEYVQAFMQRRAPGGHLATKRKEADKVLFVAGLNEKGETCGAPICAVIDNNDTRSQDYDNLKVLPRPSHADLSAYMKYGESRDVRGGGQFSGRLTAPFCVAGALCKQLLEQKGIQIGAHLWSVGNEKDQSYDKVCNTIPDNLTNFPAIVKINGERMAQVIEQASLNGDSVGAIVECKVVGVPVALGEPPFEGVENKLAQMMFAIPAVKGFEVGSGFEGSTLLGSQNNDTFTTLDGKIVTKTNNAGGINGGITNGMPLVFKVAFKPTPSIAKSQQSVNLNTKEQEVLTVVGRHDPCVGLRAVPVIEACTAIVLADLVLR